MMCRWVVPWNAYGMRLHTRGSIQEPQIGQNLLYMYIAMNMGICARTHIFLVYTPLGAISTDTIYQPHISF